MKTTSRRLVLCLLAMVLASGCGMFKSKQQIQDPYAKVDTFSHSQIDNEWRLVVKANEDEALRREKAKALRKILEGKHYRQDFGVDTVPTGDLFAASAEIDEGSNPVVVNFEVYEPYPEIMGKSTDVVLGGDIVGARIPDKVTKFTKTVICRAVGFKDAAEAEAWIKAKLQSTPVDPNDPNDPRRNFRIIRFAVDSPPDTGGLRKERGVYYHSGGNFLPSDYFKKPKKSWVDENGIVHVRKDAVLNVRRKKVF